MYLSSIVSNVLISFVFWAIREALPLSRPTAKVQGGLFMRSVQFLYPARDEYERMEPLPMDTLFACVYRRRRPIEFLFARITAKCFSAEDEICDPPSDEWPRLNRRGKFFPSPPLPHPLWFFLASVLTSLMRLKSESAKRIIGTYLPTPTGMSKFAEIR